MLKTAILVLAAAAVASGQPVFPTCDAPIACTTRRGGEGYSVCGTTGGGSRTRCILNDDPTGTNLRPGRNRDTDVPTFVCGECP